MLSLIRAVMVMESLHGNETQTKTHVERDLSGERDVPGEYLTD